MSSSPPYVTRRGWITAWVCTFLGAFCVALAPVNLAFFFFISHRWSSLASGVFSLVAGVFAIWSGRSLRRQLRRLEGLRRQLAELQAQEAQLTPGYSGRARYVPYDGGWSLFHLEFDPPMVIPAHMAARYGTPPPPTDQDPTTPGPWFPLTVEFTPAETSDVS